MPTTDKRPLKVFLCHASTDKPKVRELYRYLKKRGIQPWFDEEDLVGGQDWQVEIPKALATSDAIIICLTKNSVDKEGYIQKEIKFALDKALEMPEGRIFLIPVKFEECEVPFTLSRYQWVDLTVESGYAKMMKALKFRASHLERSTVEVSKKDVEEENLAREKKEREAVEKDAREKAEKEEAEKARIKVEEEERQRVFKEKAEREAVEKARIKAGEEKRKQIANEKAVIESAHKVIVDNGIRVPVENGHLETQITNNSSEEKDKPKSIIKPILIGLIIVICSGFMSIPIMSFIGDAFNRIESQATQSSAFSTESNAQATQFAKDIQASIAKTSAAELTLTAAAFTATPLKENQITTPVITATSNCNLAQFVTDITIPDGTKMAPGQTFVKKWRVKNVGTCTWSGYHLVFDSGDSMGGPSSLDFSTVNPGQEIDLEINLVAPSSPGSYRGYWRIVTNDNEAIPLINGNEGRSFYLDIEVVSP